MSNPRYLEVDSTYRNRNEWPLAADFQIPISQTGRKGIKDAVDPVSESASLKVWESNRFDNRPGAGAPSTLNIDFVSNAAIPVSATTGTIVIIVQSIILVPAPPPAVIQRQKDYYAAAVVQDTATNARARIISSTFMGTDSTTGLDRMSLTITTSLGTLATGTALEIIDPTDFTSISSPWIFVPNGRLQSNAYISTVIHNQTRNQTRPLKDYQSFTHLGRIDTSGSATGTNTTGPIRPVLLNPNPWETTDTYSIRINAPQLCDDISAAPPVPLLTLEGLEYIPGVAPNHRSFNLNPLLLNTGRDYTGNFLEINYQRLTGTTGLPLTTTTVDLNLGVTARANDLFVGCSLTITNSGNNSTGETRVITSYDGTTWIATVSPGFSDPPSNNTPYILECPQEAKRIVKYADYRDMGLPSSQPTGANPFIDFPATASNKSGFYQGLYIRIGPGVNNLRLITNYQVTTNPITAAVTRRAFLSSALLGPGLGFSITSGVTLPFSYSIAPGAITGFNFFLLPAVAPDTYQYACILPFSYDNLNPFVYTGSLVSQQDMVCYEVELLNLVLPNFVLAVAGGGNIAYYPYVYVELSNVSAAGAHLKNIIYSNNPNSTRVLFRAAIDDVPNPLTSTFIKIDGDGAVQTIKFKPNDTLRFRVTMQCGHTFETIQDEWFSPNIPNPTAQISAYFSLKRV